MRIRIAVLALALFFVGVVPLACSKQPSGEAAGGKKVKVLCSMFPVYVFTQNVAAGSNLQVDLMLAANMGCPHDYALTPEDMQKIATADVFVVNGLGLEEFLGEPIKKANPKIKLLDASAGIKDLIQIKDEDEDEKDHTEADSKATDHKEEGHHHHAGPNPHIFAAPRTAALMARNIADELAKVDPENAKLYVQNAADYAARLDKLTAEFAVATKTFRSKKIVTEHAVFDYLARDSGLEIVAVVEESPGQEPAAAKMLEIIKKIKESGAVALFTEPQYPAKVGQTIAKEAGIPVAALDPVANGPADAGLDYYEKTMRANLETLKKTLGEQSH